MALKNNFYKLKGIIWDWNGTLLDDVFYSVDCINKLLVKRNLNSLSRDTYKKVFTFPVKNYYEAIGFDFSSEEWEVVAMEYMETYWQNMHQLNLFEEATTVLNKMKAAGLRQFIVSAMEHKRLNEMVRDYKLDTYFEAVLGIDDHYANGKANLGSKVLMKSGLKAGEIVWVGDTYHDYEVAESLGIKTIFVACGHQDRDILSMSGCDVFETLSDIELG